MLAGEWHLREDNRAAAGVAANGHDEHGRERPKYAPGTRLSLEAAWFTASANVPKAAAPVKGRKGARGYGGRGAERMPAPRRAATVERVVLWPLDEEDEAVADDATGGAIASAAEGATGGAADAAAGGATDGATDGAADGATTDSATNGAADGGSDATAARATKQARGGGGGGGVDDAAASEKEYAYELAFDTGERGWYAARDFGAGVDDSPYVTASAPGPSLTVSLTAPAPSLTPVAPRDGSAWI